MNNKLNASRGPLCLLATIVSWFVYNNFVIKKIPADLPLHLVVLAALGIGFVWFLIFRGAAKGKPDGMQSNEDTGRGRGETKLKKD